MHQEQYTWTVREMLAGRVVGFTSPGELPAEAAVDVQYARSLGIKSSLCLPLSVGSERPVGALAFNTLRADRDWPDELVKRLQLVAQVFTNALARKRADQALCTSEARLEAAADLAGLAFYEVDFGDRTIFVDERLGDICGILPKRRRASRPWSSGWTICIPTTANACWICAGGCMKAGWSASTSTTGTSVPRMERSGFITWPG
jgi:PAS domain-containing protein